MIPRVALAMIVKGTDDEAPLLDRCLQSVTGHVDGVFIDINAKKGAKHSKQVIEVAEKHNADYTLTTWTGNFVEARTNNFARVPKDYDFIMWLDADDTVDQPKKIREVAAIVPEKVSGVYIKYDYAHDEYGNVTVSHYTSRLIRNDGTFAWKSSFDDQDVAVHETLNEIRSVGKVMNDEFKVIHHADNDRRDASLARNIELLEGMLDRTEANPDPRILFYLATHYIDAGLYGRAKVLFEKYLTLSGWAEERSQAWGYLGDIYKSAGEKDNARGCYMRAMAENPDDPSPYIELAELEMMDHLWKKAITWLETATQKKPDVTTIVLKPMEATYRAYKLLADAYANLGSNGLKKASKWLTKALELRPFDPELQEARKQLDELIKTRDLTEAALKLINELKGTKELEKIVPLIENIPEALHDSPLFHSIRNFYLKPQKWERNSIAIVCGSSALGDWGPWSLQEGIGGSEEAVIQLSKLLVEKGYRVDVFATPGIRAGVHDGVNWRNYWEFNGRDTFDILIGWRDPSLFDKAFKARKRYLWLHDVVDQEEMTKERLRNLERVIFVSQYHRDLFQMVPEAKAFVSGNGIDPSLFEELDGKFERDTKRVIYMSAHERGLELLYRIWPEVKAAVPEATLDVYYGWQGFDFVNKDNPERMQWKERIQQQEKTLDGVTNHGRIGHRQIAEEINKSGVWAYPCPFPEVYCITGVKAQAGGAWPVTSDYAALKTMVQHGVRIPMPKYDKRTHAGIWNEKDLKTYQQALINALQHPPSDKERRDMQEWARNTKSWKATAQQWHEDFTA